MCGRSVDWQRGANGNVCREVLGDIERGFERLVDSAIARGFRLHVQPAEIGRQLERALLNGTTTSVGGTMAPNAFAVRLHPDDAASFEGWSEALCREMERWLADLAFQRGLITIAPIRVAIEGDPRVRRRSVRATAQFFEGSRNAPDEHIVSIAPLTLLPLDDNRAPLLRAVSSVSLGRATGNDFIIDDEGVSRRHAMLECHGSHWHINDLGSTNGTWVNGQQVTRVRIVDGDELEVGGRRYRVRIE